MDLEETLATWDGKSIRQLDRIYALFGESKSFLRDIVRILGQEEFEIGASWLIKNHLEKGNLPDSGTTAYIYAQAHLFISWESKLHILQCIPFLGIPFSEKESVEGFLRKCLASKNKFVRAWAFGGFYDLAQRHAEFRDEARQLIASAMLEESASVKARIRNVLKMGLMANENLLLNHDSISV